MNDHKFTYEERELLIGFASGVFASQYESGLIRYDRWFQVKANLDIHIFWNGETRKLEALGYRRNMANGNRTDEFHVTILKAHAYDEVKLTRGVMVDLMHQKPLGEYSVGDVELNANYWDCECVEQYIHPKTDYACLRCQSKQEDQPDSRANEVAVMLSAVARFKPCELCNASRDAEGYVIHKPRCANASAVAEVA